MLTPRDFAVLASIVHYATLTRAQVSRLHFASDEDGRTTRKRLQTLLDAKLIARTRMQVVNPAMGAPAPVYYATREGCAFLAQERGDPRYLAYALATPQWQHLYHWVQVAETHMLLDQAIAQTPGVTVEEWWGEGSVVNPDEADPTKRFRLYTMLRDQPRLVCVPDAAFLLVKDNYRKVFYLEVDRDTTQPAQRVAARKAEGYAELAVRGLHTRHFPAANVGKFNVLIVAPSPQRRDALRAAFAAKKGAELWKFAVMKELTPAQFLAAPVWHPCVGEPLPLLKGGAA